MAFEIRSFVLAILLVTLVASGDFSWLIFLPARKIVEKES